MGFEWLNLHLVALDLKRTVPKQTCPTYRIPTPTNHTGCTCPYLYNICCVVGLIYTGDAGIYIQVLVYTDAGIQRPPVPPPPLHPLWHAKTRHGIITSLGSNTYLSVSTWAPLVWLLEGWEVSERVQSDPPRVVLLEMTASWGSTGSEGLNRG